MAPLTSYLSLLAALPCLVSAHGHVGSIVSDGIVYPGWNFSQWNDRPRPKSTGWVAANFIDNYISPDSAALPDIVCHTNATPGPLYVDAKPGSKVTFRWADWPYGNVHPGPILDYIAKCDGECTTADKTTLEWVKMDEAGLTPKGNRANNWATFDMEAADNSWTIRIPNIEPGNYVIRHEIIALHYAFRANGAQFYPQCINFKIGGSGTNKVTGGVLGTQLYTPKDAGILIDISKMNASIPYPMPGPALGHFDYV